ncbi:MAG: hypothetical protein PUC44_07055 [Eubacteriales bacterium]|nr:hypothetical protein [Eubacteriales bacterium]
MKYAYCIENGVLNGRRFAVGCLTDTDHLAELRKALSGIPETVPEIEDAEDAEDLEMALAGILETYCPKETAACAMMMEMNGEDTPAAILIGNPHDEEEETDDELEEIQKDLWCAIYPEGPGFVIGGPKEVAEKAKDIVYGMRYMDQDPWESLAAYLNTQEITAFLYVAEDPNARGILHASAWNGTATVRLGG